MVTADDLKVAVFCLCVGGGLMIKAIRKKQKTRKIVDTPRSKVASAPQGYVELEGFAWPAADVVRAVSGEEVVYYALKLQRAETRGAGKSRRREWVTVFTHGHLQTFYLVDATGLALVDPATAEVDTDGDRIRNWNALGAQERKRVIEMTAGRVTGFPPGAGLFRIFSNSYRIVEKEIGVGNPVYVHGDFRTLTQVAAKVRAPGLTEFSNRIFNREARALKNLCHFLDKNRDGVVSAEEARAGYGFAARQSRAKAKGQIATESDFEVCGRVGSSTEHPLFVADLHESHLVGRRSKHVWLQFVGGAALLALGLAQVFGDAVDVGALVRNLSGGANRAPVSVPR